MSPEPADPEVFSVVNSTRVYDGAVASVRVDEVVMPGGGTAKREVVEHDRAVAVVAIGTTADASVGVIDPRNPLDSEHTVLLIEQYRHPLGRRLWELPAGLMDVDDEPAQTAAARELFEETGFAAGTWSVLVDVATSPGFTEETVRIFLATDLTQQARPDAEHEEADLRVVQVPLSVAVQAALAGQIVNVMAVVGILAANTVLHGGAQTVPRPDDSGLASDQPWAVHSGPGVPDAPPLPGVALR